MGGPREIRPSMKSIEAAPRPDAVTHSRYAFVYIYLGTVVDSVHTSSRRPAHPVVSANSAASSASVYSSFPRPATEGSKETDRELLRTIGPMFHFSLAAGPCRV